MRCAQIFEYIIDRRSYSFVCILRHLIIIIVYTYLKVLNFYNAVKCVFKIKFN